MIIGVGPVVKLRDDDLVFPAEPEFEMAGRQGESLFLREEFPGFFVVPGGVDNDAVPVEDGAPRFF